MADATKVLIVDDDPLLLDATEALLCRAGYEVLKAASGAECEALMAEEIPDILLLDVVLPDANGMILSKRLKEDERYARTRIVLLSSLRTDSETRADGLETGAVDYIARPISNRELLARIALLDCQCCQDLESRSERDRLKTQAIHDALTGVYNRHYFNDLISAEIARARRYTHPLGLLMIDVDRFKQINDQFGHETGDSVLREIAATLSATLRESDIIVRYGGDEFLVILTEPDAEIEAVAERVRAAICDNDVLGRSGDLEVSVSVGSVWWHPDNGTAFEEALAIVDERMYEDKRRPSAG